MTSLQTIRYLIVDADGVLRRGQQALPGAPAFLPWLDRHNVRYVVVTNNSLLTPAGFCRRMAAMGIALDEQRLITSSAGAAWYLRRQAPQGARIYVIGEEGPNQALFSDGIFQRDEEKPDYVVVGLDRSLTYDKLSRACRAIHNGARFVATNTDATLPVEDGLIPGAGAIVAAVTAATGVAPVVIGKPEQALFDMALERMQAKRAETAILGDRLETDIAGGQAAGLRTILLLSGISKADELDATPYRPDFVFAGLPELMRAWQGDV